MNHVVKMNIAMALPDWFSRKGGRAVLLLVVMAGFGEGACGGEKVGSTEVGHLLLVVQTSSLTGIDKIDYEIKGRVGKPVRGAIHFDDLTRTISANVRGLVAGDGYEVTLAAASSDGDLACAGSAEFAVMPTQTTSVTAPLRCFSKSGAAVGGIGMARGYCPLIRSSSLAPTQTSVGGTVNVSVQAIPPAAGGVLAYVWSVTSGGGSFTDPRAATTDFKCAMVGDQLLTLRVSTGACADRIIITLKCVGISCGNGQVDPGETCDDGNRDDGDRCPMDCILPGCGNGKLDPSESCEPPNTATCDATCHKLSGCGNGRLEGGEECDDGNALDGDGCSGQCTLEPICGNGRVERGEECEPPGVGTCNDICRKGPIQ